MTRVGKILVLLNLGLAVMLAAWSFNIFANSVDWTDHRDTKTTPPRMGQFAIRKDKLDELWKGVAPVQTDWLRERAQLAQAEKRLDAERVWYDREIRYVLNGPAKGKGIREVTIAAQDDPKPGGVKKGEILLDNQGNPQLVPIRDTMNNELQVLSLAEYNKEDEGILKEIELQIAQHRKQIDDANALTDRIIGDKDKGIRGLQQRINDEQAKNERVLDEMKRIEPLFINTVVEKELVNKRHDQMKRRVEELKKVKIASK